MTGCRQTDVSTHAFIIRAASTTILMAYGGPYPYPNKKTRKKRYALMLLWKEMCQEIL